MMLSMELQHRQPPLSLCRDDSSLSCLPPFSSLPFQPIDGSDGDATWPWTLTPLSPLVFSPTDSRDDDASSPSLSSSPTPSSAPPPLSSSSSSSSDSASLEWSSSPSSSPTPKRPRAEGSEVAVVLAAPVKRSHREIDADRRQKEAAIVRRLEELTQEDEEGGLVGLSSKRKGGKGLRGRRKRKVVKRDKVAVLRACADRLERLEALVAQLTSVPNARDQHVKALASHLTEVAEYNQQKAAPGGAGKGSTGLLPASTAEGLAFLDRHHALYSALFVQGNCAIALIDIDTGILLDANNGFFVMSGFNRVDVINRGLTAPRRAMLASADGQVELTDEEMRQRPLIRIKPSNEWQWTEERQKAASNNAFVPCPTIRQFPASVQLANQMAEGKISSFRAPWRCIFGDGAVVETNCWCAVAATETVVEADGRRWERPTRATISCTGEDNVTVDPL